MNEMKTPEEILDEVAAENMINIQQMVTAKQLAITAIRRYARIYHQSKVKNNAVLPHVSKSYCGEQGEDNMKADIKEIIHACGDKFDFIRLCNQAQRELDEAAFDLDQESRMNGV